MFEFLPLGGAGEIGSSCFYLNIKGTGIILDCGMHPRKTGIDALPQFDLIADKNVDFVFISHAHHDHIGALPFLVKKFPYVKIFSSRQTRAIADITLHNTVAILEEQFKDIPEIKPYTHIEIESLIKSINIMNYKEAVELYGWRAIHKTPIKISAWDAGHILGAAAFLIETEDEKIFYTGDINLSEQAVIKGAELPDIKIDVLVQESTYGATDSNELQSWWIEAKRLATKMNSILQNQGSVLIPVFSLGKMQEILLTISVLMERNDLIKADIYTGGIGRKINRIYDTFRYTSARIDKNMNLSDIPQTDIYELKSFNHLLKNPSVLLLPSGMMIKSTLSYNYGMEFLKRNNFGIFTVGYMDIDTPGYLISKASSNTKILLDEKKEVAIKCNIENFKFSAHSRREELLEIVDRLLPERVIFIHGEEKAINWLGESILKNYPKIKANYVINGKEYNF